MYVCNAYTAFNLLFVPLLRSIYALRWNSNTYDVYLHADIYCELIIRLNMYEFFDGLLTRRESGIFVYLQILKYLLGTRFI